MSRLLGSLGRGARRAIRIGWWSLLLLPFFAIPAGYAVEYSNTPQFCNSCHIMEPFYEAWKAGTHASVACVQCHYPPDVKGKLWTKFQGLAQLVSYVTATESTRPSAHVHDGSCTQCHAREALSEKTEYGRIRFDHGPHLDASTPGRELKCTSCHSQTTRDQHMAIDSGACFLCHLKDQPPGQAIGGCTGCHVMSVAKVENEGLAFDHASVDQRGIGCDSCHRDVTRGTGEVTRNRCLQCHAAPADLALFEEATSNPETKDRLHHAHVKIAAVDCRSCHDEIVHGKVANGRPHPPMTGDCSGCHAKGHELQAAFSAGKGARGLAGRPEFMFHLGMSCESCHREAPGHEADPAAVCFSCHGKGVRGMLDEWKTSLGEWSKAFDADLEKVTTALGTAPPEALGKLLSEARANVALVAKARGVHNIRYSEAIFRHARATLEDVLKQSGKQLDLGSFSVPKEDQDCRSCHVGAERIDGLHEGYPFPHAPHVGKARLACDDCHARGMPHGGLDMPVKRCAECHHTDDNEDCAKCHGAAARLYAGTDVPGVAPRPDPMKAQVPCAACHTDRAAKDQVASLRKTCVECHDDKYGPMLDEWLKEGEALLRGLIQQTATARVALVDGDRKAAGHPEARAIVDDAEKLIAVLEKGRFGHNPALAREAVAKLEARLARVPDLVKAAN